MWSYFKLTVWAVLWLWLLAFFFIFTRKGRDNCLSWAMRKHDEDGGYIVIRWCRSNKVRWLNWPHFLWLDKKHGEHLMHYVPVEKDHDEKFVPHPWFKGHIKKGDNESDIDEN